MAKDVCVGCGREDDLRFGFCFYCASAGELRAARRTVFGHSCRGLKNLLRGRWWQARMDFSWAYERLTRTGDYQPGGEFERLLAESARRGE
jgi:hypothetical protein